MKGGAILNKLQTTIKLTQLLYKNGCTYNEVDEFLSDVQQHYKTIREQKEYDTINDFIKGNKSCDIGSEIVNPLPNLRSL